MGCMQRYRNFDFGNNEVKVLQKPLTSETAQRGKCASISQFPPYQPFTDRVRSASLFDKDGLI
jgi:hypothetical protein